MHGTCNAENSVRFWNGAPNYIKRITMNGKLIGICITIFVMAVCLSFTLYNEYQLEQAVIQEYNDIKIQEETRKEVRSTYGIQYPEDFKGKRY